MHNNGHPAIVISAGNSPIAYDIVRSLGKEGVRTTVASTQADDIAVYSKYCAGNVPLFHLSPETDEENLKRLIAYAQQQTAPPVLFYASDPELSFIRRQRTVLSRWFKFILPDEFTLECLFNKALFSSFALAYRLPVPHTVVIHDVEELPSVLDQIEFPCIVKPAFSEDWRWDTDEQQERFGSYKQALHRITSFHELISFCTALPQRQSGVLIQSYVEGRDEHIFSFHGYFDEQSQCLGYFIGRKIRTYPPHTGGSTYIRTYHHPALAELSVKYLQRIHFQGIVKIDYKWDEWDNEFQILEINPRYNLWCLLGVYAGINLAYIAYRHQSGGHYAVPNRYKENVRLLYLKQDLRSFFYGYRLNGEWTFLRYLRSLLQQKYFRVFDPKDIMPFLHSCYSFLLRNIGRALSLRKSSLTLAARRDAPILAAKKQLVEVFDETLH